MTKYVGIIQQGMILDQRIIEVGTDEDKIKAAAEAAADKLNNEQTGFGEAYSAVVLPVHK